MASSCFLLTAALLASLPQPFVKAQGYGSTDLFLPRRALFEIMRSSGHRKLDDQIRELKQYVEKRTNCPGHLKVALPRKLSHYITDFKSKWLTATRKKDRFLLSNKSWLDTSIKFPNYSINSSNKGGRPEKPFDELSDRRKRQRTESLRAEHSSKELSYAAQMSLRSTGAVEASKVVKEVTCCSPKRASTYRTAYKKFDKTKKRLDGTTTLAMMTDAKLTRHQYNVIRQFDRERFPPYKEIQKAKKACYPENGDIAITETLAEVKLQPLLNHTASRLLLVQEEVVKSIPHGEELKLKMISKWGFDGSNQTEFKQRFGETNESDANVFITSMVPLSITKDSPEDELNETIIWQNQTPSSTRTCRVIRFQFKRETTELSQTEKTHIENQINQLEPTICQVNGRLVQVKHMMLFTMIDGKVCNAVTETSSTQRCYVCNLTSKDFNDLGKVLSTTVIESSRLQFGLSMLHAWIRFFECVLHLGYKLPIKQWQARGQENKAIVAETKKQIQKLFKSEMGLTVDKPKPGFGNSNDGNTARRFFDNPVLASDITGVDIELIKRFKTILETLASGFKINTEKFREFALKTAQLYIKKYHWYQMPPSVHKILIYGHEIIDNALLPIGQLSEEAQEARNKDFKRYRSNFSRRCSRLHTNEDVLHLLLISSDPLISSLRKSAKRSRKSFSADALSLLTSPEVNITTENVIYLHSSSSDSEDEN